MKLEQSLARTDARIAYSDSGGDGFAVVLTHGAGVDHSMFDAQFDALVNAGFRVIVWDLRGHGTSVLDKDASLTPEDLLGDLEALLDHCEITTAALVGHSLGGNLSQAFTVRNPHRVDGVVVLDSTWNSGPLSGFERFALKLAAPMLALVPAKSLPGLMARASAVSPEAIARTQKVFERMPKSRFLAVWRTTTSFVAPDPGRRSPVPIALIRGAEDRTGNIATAMPRWAQAEGVAEHVIPDAGHMVTWDSPEAVTAALLNILGTWSSTTNEDEPDRQ